MSYLNNTLKGKRILVTGATGFIGGRLAQRLAGEEGAMVTGTGRSLDKVPFLKEAGVTLLPADLRDEAALRTAVAGQEIVFHTAAWVGGGRMKDDLAAATALNVTATETLVRLAQAAGAARLVLVSSIAAYGRPAKTDIDETTPLDTTQPDVYGRTKALGDNRVREVAAEVGLDVVVARPAMVYGPRSMGWTVGLLKLVQRETPVLFGDGAGHAWPVYIDNLIDGLLLTAVHHAAAGEAFNFCDQAVTWRVFFEYYGRMCGKRPRRLPLWMASLLAGVNGLFKLGLPLNQQRLKFLTSQAVYPTDKAQTRLGYRARVSLDEGMAAAESWLHAQGYLQG